MEVLHQKVCWVRDCIQEKPGEPPTGLSATGGLAMMTPGQWCGWWGSPGMGVRARGRSVVGHRGMGPGGVFPTVLGKSHCFPHVGSRNVRSFHMSGPVGSSRVQ